MSYLSSGMWVILKPVHSHACTDVPKGGEQHLLCNIAVMCWLADSSHIHQCALVKVRVGLDESIDCSHPE